MKHEQELERISGLTQEEVVNEQLQRVEEELSQDIAVLVKEKRKLKKKLIKSKRIISYYRSKIRLTIQLNQQFQ